MWNMCPTHSIWIQQMHIMEMIPLVQVSSKYSHTMLFYSDTYQQIYIETKV